MATKKQTPADALDINQDPSICCMSGTIEFADKPEKVDSQNLRLKLYDGRVNQHWYYGNLAFDLPSMKLEKSKIPILMDHDTSQRLGFSTGATFDPAFILDGKFMQNDEFAQKIRAQAKEGFPFEASLRFNFEKARPVKVADGETAMVNGHKFKGPGTIWYDAPIKEGSVCTFGALKGCRSNVFNHQQKERTMPRLEEFKAENAELYQEVFNLGIAEGKTSGEANERAIFDELRTVCGDDDTLLVACYSEGKTVTDAITMKTAKMKAENDALRQELSEAQKTPKAPEVPTDIAATEFSDAEAKQKAAALAAEKLAGGSKESFMDKVTEYVAEHKVDKATALDACVDLYPELHAKLTWRLIMPRVKCDECGTSRVIMAGKVKRCQNCDAKLTTLPAPPRPDAPEDGAIVGMTEAEHLEITEGLVAQIESLQVTVLDLQNQLVKSLEELSTDQVFEDLIMVADQLAARSDQLTAKGQKWATKVVKTVSVDRTEIIQPAVEAGKEGD